LDAGEVQRQADKLACSDARDGCPELCTAESIESDCVRGCKADARVCKKDAKGVERQCKKDCVKGPGRRACIRGCRMQYNIDLQVCTNQGEIPCLAGCAGIEL
jgi:hypothetical protein